MEWTGASSLGKANARAPCVRDFERQYVVDFKKKIDLLQWRIWKINEKIPNIKTR